MSKLYRLLVIACALAVIAWVRPAIGQSTSASLNGAVVDTSGAIVGGAQITVRNTGTDLTQTVVTNSSGNYGVSPLPAGQYTITVQRSGFRQIVQTGVILTVNQAATLNFTLQVGSQQETVTVTASQELIDQTTAALSTVIDEQSIKDLPLNGRDPSTLVFLAPGMNNVLNSSVGVLQGTDSFPNETGASAGGGRQGSTLYLLDGVPNMDTYQLLAAPFPNSDATQEFRVITNNFDAQYGFSPGAVVSIGTKSGTNELHGGLFEFIRNNDLNAGNYFSHAVDSLKRNQFGGYAGGPILKDKLFIFGNYQATREAYGASTNTTFTPTTAMLNGDFSAVPSTLGGPFKTVNGVPNQIDPSVFDKAAVTIAETALPTGQVPATGQVNYALSSVTESFDEGTLRLDYALSSKQRIFARSFIQSLVEPATVVKGNVLATNEAGMGRYYNETISHTWIVNPTLVNVASAGWTRNDWSNEAEVFDSSGNAFCLSKYINVADPAGSCYVEGLNVENAFSTPWAEPNRNIRTTWTFTDTLTKTVKNHTIVAGMDLYHQWADTQTQYPAQAIVGFDGYAGDVGFGLADFLLGEVSSMQQGAFQYSPTKGWEMAFYGQDQYKLKPNLTITAGLRWEPEIPPEDVNGGSAFIPGQQSVRYPGAPLGLNFPGDKGVDAALMPNDYANFAPRIGVAWQPHRLPHTALRGGFGLFSAPISYSYYNHTVGIAPFCPFYSLSATAADPINFDNPWHGFQSTGGQSPFTPTTFVQNPKAPSSATFTTPFSVPASFSRNFKLGITQSWTASIEQQLFSQYALHLAYVGSQSYHQTTKVDMNPGIYADGNARSTYPLFSSVIVDTPAGTASYHSLQIGMERRMVKGLQFQSNFTWSKAIDLSSSGNISFGGELGDPFDYAWDRGISDLNIPLSWVSNFVYVTPTLDRSNGFLKNALGAWELSTIWSLQSGRPFSVSGGNGNDSSGSLQGGDRADLTGKPFNVRQGSKSQWLNEYFNKAAFAPNLPGTFGDSGRNLLKGPGIDTADVAVIKNWKAAERYGLQFRWEMFNAFNHASFANPNSDSSPTNGSEGQISSIGPIAPRVMQGGLKLILFT
jgi:hypothetical protein